MSLLYIDGFDWAVDQVAGYGGAGRWVAGVAGDTNYDVVTTGLRGAATGAALKIQSSAQITHALGANVVTGFCGIAFKMATAPSSATGIIEFDEAAASQSLHLSLIMNTNGTFRIQRGSSTVLETGTFQLGTDTWCYLEMKWTISNTVGVFELRINGSDTPDIDFSGGDTQNAGNAYVDGITLQGSTHDWYFDDFYVADDAASQDFYGDVSVETLVADGTGAASDFTPSAGSNYQNVEELPTDNDTTYNESSTVDHDDRFSHGDLTTDTEDVLGVQVGIWAKKDDAGGREMRTLAEDGTTEGEGAAHALTTDYVWYTDMFEDHPSGAAAWTESEVSSGEFGYTIES
jgi:hypothetical protein